MKSVSNVLVPVDLESAAFEPIEYARMLSEIHGARADLLYASKEPLSVTSAASSSFESERMLEVIENILEWFCTSGHPNGDHHGPQVVGHIHPGNPAATILDFARDSRPDFIVMGAARKLRASTPHGDVVETVMQNARVPVVVFPAVDVRARHESAIDISKWRGTSLPESL